MSLSVGKLLACPVIKKSPIKEVKRMKVKKKWSCTNGFLFFFPIFGFSLFNDSCEKDFFYLPGSKFLPRKGLKVYMLRRKVVLGDPVAPKWMPDWTSQAALYVSILTIPTSFTHRSQISHSQVQYKTNLRMQKKNLLV